MNADGVRAAYAAAVEAAGPEVTVVAATKYVPLERDGGARRGGRAGGGREPRAGSAGEARRVRRRLPLALHRSPPVEQGQGRRRASASSFTPSRPTPRPGGSRSRGCSRSTSRARSRRAACAPDEVAGWVARYPLLRGLMTMPPLADDPERVTPVLPRPARACARRARPAQLSMGTSQDWRIAVEEGATHVRIGSALWQEDVLVPPQG